MDQKRLGRGLQSLLPNEPETHVGHNVLPIDQIVANHRQPREVFDDAALERLSDSIRQNGVLQPIVVRRRDKQFEIIAGERRWRAAMRAGLKAIPSVVRENVSESELLELAILENVQRVDLNPIEKAKGFKRLTEEFGKTQDDIAKGVGQDRTTIANTLRLLELPEEMQDAVQRNAISGGHARALLSIPDAIRRRLAFEKTLREDLSVRELERVATEHGAKKRPEGKKRRSSLPPWVAELEDRWRRRLGVKVDLGLQGHRARISIHCASLDELERVTDLAVGLPNSTGKDQG